MEVTSLPSSSWSYRPEPNLIGVSVFKNQNQFSSEAHTSVTQILCRELPVNEGPFRPFYGSTRKGIARTL